MGDEGRTPAGPAPRRSRARAPRSLAEAGRSPSRTGAGTEGAVSADPAPRPVKASLELWWSSDEAPPCPSVRPAA